MLLPSRVQQDFQRAKAQLEAAPVWLHLGADSLWLVREGEGGVPVSLALDLGTDRTAQRFFQSERPTPMELERAIDHVEDEVMRASAWAAHRLPLATNHPIVHSLAQGQGASLLSQAVVEALFQRMASGALGDPSALKGLPEGREAAATLLILRELMHHLSFAEVAVIAAAPGPA